MIDYDNKNAYMVITCNTCGAEIELLGDYKYCISEAKSESWIMIKKKGVFLHYCSKNCKGECYEK